MDIPARLAESMGGWENLARALHTVFLERPVVMRKRPGRPKLRQVLSQTLIELQNVPRGKERDALRKLCRQSAGRRLTANETEALAKTLANNISSVREKYGLKAGVKIGAVTHALIYEEEQ